MIEGAFIAGLEFLPLWAVDAFADVKSDVFEGDTDMVKKHADLFSFAHSVEIVDLDWILVLENVLANGHLETIVFVSNNSAAQLNHKVRDMWLKRVSINLYKDIFYFLGELGYVLASLKP